MKSSAGAIPRGIDQPSNLKYETSSGAEYIKHNADAHASVSDVVGVQRNQDTYKKPVDPTAIYKFYGVDPTEGDEIIQRQQMEANKRAFFAGGDDTPQRAAPRQGMSAAEEVFWGVEAKVQGRKQGAPIPGTGTFQPRVEADGIFATTFQASKEFASTSQNRIKDEKADTLKQAQQWMPYQ